MTLLAILATIDAVAIGGLVLMARYSTGGGG